MQYSYYPPDVWSSRVSIPQAVWIACNQEWCILPLDILGFNTASGMDCMQCKRFSALRQNLRRFNTASGMDCMQSQVERLPIIPVRFQYRKRYGLHAISPRARIARSVECFNTASGMDCMQFPEIGGIIMKDNVSIPQAVWIACNKYHSNRGGLLGQFQYRKRYGLHAMRRLRP